jgi:lipopolysaccharide/colanic/teichoic acid biosynthesis glycosyltransferase
LYTTALNLFISLVSLALFHLGSAMSPATFTTPTQSNLQISLREQLQDPSASVSPIPVSQTTEMIAVPTPLLAPPTFLDEMIHPSVNSKLKRCLDIVGALAGLFVTALLFIPIAIAIWREDPGSIFYSQERCGVGGKRFRILKFRSMVMDADAIKHLLKNEASGHIFKIEDDPRVTRIGKLLRRTSLDEFPQFWNVLMGDMSLVGTRPPSVDEVAHYDSHHWQRLAVKPGITGEWQVNGRSSVKDFEDIVKLDLAYQAKWSFAYDVKILVKTVLVVLKKQGAC